MKNFYKIINNQMLCWYKCKRSCNSCDTYQQYKKYSWRYNLISSTSQIVNHWLWTTAIDISIYEQNTVVEASWVTITVVDNNNIQLISSSDQTVDIVLFW